MMISSLASSEFLVVDPSVSNMDTKAGKLGAALSKSVTSGFLATWYQGRVCLPCSPSQSVGTLPECSYYNAFDFIEWL